MKKSMKRIITALFLMLLSMCCYAQEFSEGFEDAWTAGTGPNTGPPGGWGVYENGTGAAINWVRSTAGNATQPVYAGDHAAFINKESVATGIAEDWLVTKQFTVPENAQVRFFSRLTTPAVEGNTYEVRISTEPLQESLSEYDLLVSWTETEINPTYNLYTEKVIDIPEAYYGEDAYIALIMKNNNGDRWLVDNFRVIKKCMPPVDITIPAGNISLNSAQVTWTNNSGASEWEVEAIPVGQPFTGVGQNFTTPPPVTINGLLDSTPYNVRVRAICDGDVPSDWSNPVNFSTEYSIPDNDECSSAIVLTVNPGQTCTASTTGYITAATASSQGNTCTGTADDDVWYEFTATGTSHIVTLSGVTGSDTDMVHAVYEDGCDALTLRYCSDNDTSNAINLTVGETYKVRVYSKSASAQSVLFNICISTPPPPPANDECANAATVQVNAGETCVFTTPGTVYSATASPQANTCGGSDDDDVWYEFTATSTAHLISLLDVTGGTPDLFHALYTGDDCDALTQLYCSNPDNSLAQGLIIGQKYKIRVYSFTGTGGQTTAFNVCVSTPPPPPVNDNCGNATVLTVNPTLECAATTTGTIYAATASAEANACNGTDDDDVWYEFTATSDSHTISLLNVTGSTNNLYHVLYAGSDCGALTQVYCSDPNTSTATGLTIGQVYKVRVYSFTATSAQDSTFDICISTPPAPPVNDDCTTATVVPVNATDVCTETATGTLLAATGSPEANTCTGIADDDVWYQFTATNTIHLIKLLNITGSALDLLHAVYSGSDCGALTQLYCSDPNSSVAMGLTIGQVYKIRIYSATGTTGQNTTFAVCVSTPPPPPVNDDCAAAITVPVNTGNECTQTVPGTIYSATPSPAATACTGTADDDVWFTFTATATNHNIAILNPTTAVTLVHALYAGNDCSELELLYCSELNTSRAAYLIPGETYTLRVYSLTDDAGQTSAFEVCITTPEPPIFTDNTTYTVPELVSEVLVSTDCAQISNLSWKTGNTDGLASSNGLAYFTGNGSGFPIDKGIVLSSGDAFVARGPNTSELSNGSGAWPGDDDLYNYIDGLGIDDGLEDYNNATVLEFDFVPLTGHISFPFVFASEEYGTYQCTFSDAFAFFLTNTETGETTNLAVLPGTNVPISVVTIRDAANNDCDAANPEYYAQNNEGGNALAADINFNGQTVLLTAQSDVSVNTVYHIKLVIADRNDELLDSAVFIGPFNIGNIDLGNDLLVDTLTALCDGETYVIDSNIDPALYDIKWRRNDVIIPGETTPSITVTEPGTYTIEALYLTSTCTATESIVIEYYDPVAETTGDPANLVLCDTTGSALFDLEENTDVILADLNAADYTLTYHLTAEAANNNTGALESPYENITPVQTIYVRISNDLIGCYAVKSFTITASDLTPEFDIDDNCKGNDYTLTVTAINGTFDPQTASYAWAGPGGFTSFEREISIAMPGEYMVAVTTAEGCRMTASRTVGENPCLIPRGISPNNDELNDHFDLTGMSVARLGIFNRYGQEVYSKSNYTDEWYGQGSNGDELPTGTYYYMIELTGGETKTGWVYINREE
jgi:gliding motility-associated-like protein